MKFYTDLREVFLKKFIIDKTVLDLWAADNRHRFLHKFIADNAKKAVWLELDAERAHNLQKKWYNVLVGNAESFELNEKFDVVVGWDIIEHVDNPWLMLDSIKKHLKPDGLFVFNTPNIFCINFLLKWLFRGWRVPQFSEHINGYNEPLIRELLSRHGYEIESITYFSHKEPNIQSHIIRFFGLFSKYRLENMFIVSKVIGSK